MSAAKFTRHIVFNEFRDVELAKVKDIIAGKDVDITTFASQPKVVRFTDTKIGWQCKLANYPQASKVSKDIYRVPSFYVLPEAIGGALPKNVWLRVGMQVTKASSSSEGGFVVYPSMAMIPLTNTPRRPSLWCPPMELEGVKQRDIFGLSGSNEDEEESTASGDKQKKKRRAAPVVWNPRNGKCTYVVQLLLLKTDSPEPEHTMVFDHPDVIFTAAFEHDKEPVKAKKPKKEDEKKKVEESSSSSDDGEKAEITKNIKKIKPATPTPDLVMSLLGEQ